MSQALAPVSRPDPLGMLMSFLTARAGREAELLEANNRSLERAREADRRFVAAIGALSQVAAVAAMEGLPLDQRLSAAAEAAQDALAEVNQTDGAMRLAGTLLVNSCHAASTAAGWWQDPVTGEDLGLNPYMIPCKLMLTVSELAEAMEGHRKGLPDDKLPHRPMIEVECADAVIRIADLCGRYGWDLGGAIAEKMAFNARRPDHTPENRAAAGGKAY